MPQPHNYFDDDMLSDRHKKQLGAIHRALLPAVESNGIKLSTNRGVLMIAAPDNFVNHPSKLKITPMFPGSLTQHQVVIGTESDDSNLRLINDERDARSSHIVADVESHYAHFRPLPDPLQNKISGENNVMHILLLPTQNVKLTKRSLNRLDVLCPENSIVSVLNRGPRHNAATTAIIKHLRSSDKAFTAIHAIDVAKPSHYLSMLSKADMLLASDQSDCVDAVSLNTPTGLWDDQHPLSQALQDWMNGGSRNRLLKEQQAWLSALRIKRIKRIKRIGSGLAVSSRTELLLYIQNWLGTDQIRAETIPAGTMRASEVLHICGTDDAIIPTPNLSVTPTAGKRLMNNLDISHRKFAKFRESPSRFFHDSRHPWLRPLQRH